jgi:ribosomal-protein-alanine N-acetyltransferase
MNLEETLQIREMRREDLNSVLAIERRSFRTPWSRGLFEKELIVPFARDFVAWSLTHFKIVGYLCMWIMGEEMHILNLAVHPQERNKGIGTYLLGYGVEVGRSQGMQEITLEVRRSNYQAISLYRNFQFQPRGIRPGYYQDSGEDAIIMGLHLDGKQAVGLP